MSALKKKIDLITASLAIFAMFFGAGNIVFPLAIGTKTLDQTPLALIGFLLTAVIVPFMGLLAMFLYQGQVQPFFNRIGKLPGFCLAFFTIALLGPLGSAPRCLSLAYSTLKLSMPDLSLIAFSTISILVIFCFVFRPGKMLSLLGYVLSPIKISLLAWIIIQGWIYGSGNLQESHSPSSLEPVLYGLKEGYNTMDLLAAFFFAPLVFASLKKKEGVGSSFLLQASLLAALLLSVVYLGFAQVAYFYADKLGSVPTDKLLGAIAIHVLGPKGGLLVGITVTIACLTTAIALIAAFVNFIQKEVLQEKVGYIPVLIVSLMITLLITTLEFQGIAKFLGPILEVCYPLFIGLTIYNLIYRKTSPSFDS